MKNLIIALILMLFCSYGFCQQNSSLQIKDLVMTRDDISKQTDPLNTAYTVAFKISAVATAKKAFLQLGPEKDSGSIVTLEGTYVRENGNYFLRYGANSFPVSNYTSFIKFKIPKVNEGSLKFLTFNIEDVNGLATQKLYFQIKP